jgi:hypothetical protein
MIRRALILCFPLCLAAPAQAADTRTQLQDLESRIAAIGGGRGAR